VRSTLRVASILTALACSAVATGARADGDSMARAEALFRSGSRGVDAGRYAEACPQLEQARALVAGIGVNLYLGECYEQTGRPLAAWRMFRDAERLAIVRSDSRASIAHERAQLLWPRLAKLTVIVPAGGAVRIEDDGTPLDAGELGTERPVDPGPHRVRASAVGRAAWETTIEIAPRESARVEVPPLPAVTAPEIAAPLVPTAATDATPAPEVLPAPAPAPHPSLGPRRVAGIAVFGVGIVGLTVGTIFGLQARSKLQDSNSSGHCRPDDRCDPAGIAERSDALTDATISTASFIGGAAFLVGGAALVLLGPKESQVAFGVTPRADGGASVVFHGRW
jgi:hypothetical protein